MKAYMKNNFEFLGVRSPDRRKAAKQYFKDFKRQNLTLDFVEACWDQPTVNFNMSLLITLVVIRKT